MCAVIAAISFCIVFGSYCTTPLRLYTIPCFTGEYSNISSQLMPATSQIHSEQSLTICCLI